MAPKIETHSAPHDDRIYPWRPTSGCYCTKCRQARDITRLESEREVLLDHLDHARAAIGNAQQWADTWRGHALLLKARVTDLEAK
jgi:hypothetical protein